MSTSSWTAHILLHLASQFMTVSHAARSTFYTHSQTIIRTRDARCYGKRLWMHDLYSSLLHTQTANSLLGSKPDLIGGHCHAVDVCVGPEGLSGSPRRDRPSVEEATETMSAGACFDLWNHPHQTDYGRKYLTWWRTKENRVLRERTHCVCVCEHNYCYYYGYYHIMAFFHTMVWLCLTWLTLVPGPFIFYSVFQLKMLHPLIETDRRSDETAVTSSSTGCSPKSFQRKLKWSIEMWVE